MDAVRLNQSSGAVSPGAGNGAPFYLSADSAPVGYARRRSPWTAPLFLLVLALGCSGLVPTVAVLGAWYGQVLTLAGSPSAVGVGDQASISFRPFVFLLILCLGVFALGTAGQKLKLVLFGSSVYAVSMVVLDLAMVDWGHLAWVPKPMSPEGGLVAGFGGLFAIAVTIFSCYHLPQGVRVKTRLRRPRSAHVPLIVCAAFAVAAVAVLSHLRERYLPGLHVRFVGGLDSGIVLFLLALFSALLAASARDRRHKPTGVSEVPIAFLVPACNEAHGIAECIEALDVAAESYGSPCHLYVVVNGSSDDTGAVAAEALRRCHSLEGQVLDCPTPGKSHALNFGLAQIREEVVVRIDADTLVDRSLLPKLVAWFNDPRIGGVSGLPLPRRDIPGWLHALRIIEVYYGVAFLRVAQGAADAVMVLPGLVAAYRRSVLEELGGFGEGFNGEDADITMRIGRLGYRIITDPTIKVQSEVPRTLAHLREQRQRWARGLFHMAHRNMSSITMGQGIRGLVVLPWSIANGIRRSMMVPILVCAGTVELLDPTVFRLEEVSVLAGFLAGLQVIVITVLLVRHRYFKVVPFVPAYLLFRLFRAYVAFETVLTLRLAPVRKRAQQSPEPISVNRSTATDPLALVTFSE